MKVNPPTDIVVIDEPETCPYLPDQVARMPLRLPLRRVTLEETDQRLAQGHRRTGEFVYQTHCPTCQQCQAIRIPIASYKFSSNQRRVLNKGDRKYAQHINDMVGDEHRVALFNRHRQQRGLSNNDKDIDLEEYLWGFVKSCFRSFEISYRRGEELACVAICDLGATSMSAVYTFYDPDLRSDSIGTYSILKQIEFCKRRNLEYLYLGYYVRDCSHMVYKSRFTPQQRLIAGQWISFDRDNPVHQNANDDNQPSG